MEPIDSGNPAANALFDMEGVLGGLKHNIARIRTILVAEVEKIDQCLETFPLISETERNDEVIDRHKNTLKALKRLQKKYKEMQDEMDKRGEEICEIAGPIMSEGDAHSASVEGLE